LIGASRTSLKSEGWIPARFGIELGRETCSASRCRLRTAKGAVAEGAFCRFQSRRVGLPPDQIGVGNRLHAPSLRDRRCGLASGLPGLASRHAASAVQKNVLRYYIEGGADLNSEPPMVLGATGPNRTFRRATCSISTAAATAPATRWTSPAVPFSGGGGGSPFGTSAIRAPMGMWGILNEIIERMKPGVSMRELFEYSQSRLAQHPEWRNYSDHPSKRIGHGIGLENEPPSISANRRYDPRSPHGADAGTEIESVDGLPSIRRNKSLSVRRAARSFQPDRIGSSTSSPDRNKVDEYQAAQRTKHPLSRPDAAGIVALVEEAYRLDAEGKVEVPTKIGVHPERANAFLHAMPAWVGGACALGMKWVSYFPGNFDRGLPDSTGIIILNDPDHGLPCCIMEGMYVTFLLRTAGCAAVAAKYLAPRPPKTLGLIGCGGLGLWSLRVMSTTFPSIEQVYVSSRTKPLARGVLREDDAGGKLDNYTS